MTKVSDEISITLSAYQASFRDKVHSDENNDHDLLMDVFGITPELKRENRQYWGRELGMCWQRIVYSAFRSTRTDVSGPIRWEGDEPCDMVVGKYAIDTKYRIGSGDSGTLKKFKSYGHKFIENGYVPVFVILRNDNLPAAISACQAGNWQLKIGSDAFAFIHQESGFDLLSHLQSLGGVHRF